MLSSLQASREPVSLSLSWVSRLDLTLQTAKCRAFRKLMHNQFASKALAKSCEKSKNKPVRPSQVRCASLSHQNGAA